jgi:hypothetical protein
MRPLLLITFIAFSFNGQAQKLDTKVLKAVQTVYNQYKLFFDSSLLGKYVVLDTKKSYLVNSQTQKIKTLAIADNTFAFDEFSLSFAVIYMGDTIRHLPPCRLDTFQNLMVLGTPTNPVQHGDLLPPYLELVNGSIPFDYKKLQKLLHKIKVETTNIDLKPATANDKKTNAAYKAAYNWHVTTACPEIKCREFQVSATNGKIIADKQPINN